jgi:predicted transposase/invertase (TIGR01784 family)
MLPLKDDERVEHLEYWPAEKIPRRTQIEKDSIVDVCCRDNKHREFIVEMQMTWTEAFKNRVLLNASKAYVAQTEVGESYGQLQPVYALNFVNDPMNINAEGYYHHYQLVHQQNSDEVISGLQLVFIELPKFKPQTMAERKMQVLWLRFLTEINAKTREVPPELLANPEVSQALRIVEEAAYTPAEMRTYNKFWDNVSISKTLEEARRKEDERRRQEDERRRQEDERLKAFKEQVEAQKEQVEAQKEQVEAMKRQAEEAIANAEARTLHTARCLKAMNMMTAEQIAQATGLTVQQVESL